MADLVRKRTEIECLLEDFKQAGEGGEARRAQISEELEAIETRLGEASERLVELALDLEERQTEEKEAKEA